VFEDSLINTVKLLSFPTHLLGNSLFDCGYSADNYDSSKSKLGYFTNLHSDVLEATLSNWILILIGIRRLETSVMALLLGFLRMFVKS
jgi:hypothetical protein